MTAGDAVPVLMYHEIAAATDTASRLAVPPGAFAAQLRYLHDQGFSTLTAGAAAAALTGGSHRLPTRSIVLTFDDGFADFHREALPVLLQYGFTATLFVTTGWVQDAGRFSAGQRPGRMLTWSQIAEIAGAGVEIGAHSHRHPQLDQLPGRLLRPELRDSRAQLEDRLGRQVPGMAYPFGYSNARVRQVVREAGHQYAYAVGNVIARTGADPFALPRLTIRRSTSPAAFADIAHGRNVWPLFRKDRTLTKGWAVVRRTRSMVGRAVRDG
jgi:peptidoglycan/xylan/chitin deacetylase (PgdA/CDA1 family)